MASEEAVLAGLEKMKHAGMKGAPDVITAEQIAIWAEMFAGVPDDHFEAGVTEVIRTEVFFPAIGSLYQLSQKRAEQKTDLAWLLVKAALSKYGLRRCLPKEDGNFCIVSGWDLEELPDPYALWAVSQMEFLETLTHREQPHRFAEDKRQEFSRLYRVAIQNGYKLDAWDGKLRPLENLAELAALEASQQKALTVK